MVTYEEFVENGLKKTKYEQLGGDVHDVSTDESDMYEAMTVNEMMQNDKSRSFGVISILTSPFMI